MKPRSVLKKIYNIFKIIFKVRWYKTIRINFALLPFDQAIKLPIVVTGKLIIDSLKGHVTIEAPLKFGMIIFGNSLDNMPIECCPGRLLVAGEIKFKGHCVIAQSANICVWKNGKIEIGHCVCVCSGVLLKSTCSIKIGNYTRLTSGCFIMDTNVHLIRDINTGYIARNFAPILIGSHCWLTMNTSVTAGTVLPDYCITARGSLLNKNYSRVCGEGGAMIGGTPAKVIKIGVRRLFYSGRENKVNAYFMANPDAQYYQDVPGFDEPEEINVVKEFTI